MKQFPVIPEGHKLTRTLPKNFREADRPMFQSEFTRELPGSQVAILENVQVTEYYLFGNFSRYNQYSMRELPDFRGTLRNYARILQSMARPKTTVEEAFWIVDSWSHAYFHWFGDALPRLLACREHSSCTRVLLPAFFQKYTYIPATLEILGIEPVYYELPDRVLVKRLITASHLAPAGNFFPDIMKDLRTALTSRLDASDSGKRIYISRGKAPRRKILNEPEIIPILEKHGFEIRYFEDIPFVEQLRLAASCSHLVSLHGAGLTNMLFMRPGTSVLEFRNATDTHYNCYFTMASDLDIDYYYLKCQGDTDDAFDSNVVVDPADLEAVLTAMLEG